MSCDVSSCNILYCIVLLFVLVLCIKIHCLQYGTYMNSNLLVLEIYFGSWIGISHVKYYCFIWWCIVFCCTACGSLVEVLHFFPFLSVGTER